jgi:hypothetical protein
MVGSEENEFGEFPVKPTNMEEYLYNEFKDIIYNPPRFMQNDRPDGPRVIDIIRSMPYPDREARFNGVRDEAIELINDVYNPATQGGRRRNRTRAHKKHHTRRRKHASKRRRSFRRKN